MKRLLFYIILFGIAKFTHGQISGIYSLKHTYYATYDIEFYPNQYYFFGIRINYGEQIDSKIISFGKYTEENNEIVLMDCVHGYRIMLLHKNDSVIMKTPFVWLKDKRFKYQGKTYDNSDVLAALDITKDMPLSLEQERKEYQLSAAQIYPLNIGKYSNNNEYSHELYLAADSTYRLEFHIGYWKLAFFEGMWNRNGNELILYDTNLQCDFYMFIDEDKLISKLLPGDYEETTLYYRDTK